MSEYPEGRTPLTWQDMLPCDKPKGHPSTFEAECKQLRRRVAELEAALEPLLLRLCEWAADNLTDENVRDWCGHVEPPLERARAALNPPQEPPEATTDPL